MIESREPSSVGFFLSARAIDSLVNCVVLLNYMPHITQGGLLKAAAALQISLCECSIIFLERAVLNLDFCLPKQNNGEFLQIFQRV